MCKKRWAIGKKILAESKYKQEPKKQLIKKKSMSSDCPPGKILNPATGRCVNEDGAIGKKILAESKDAKPTKKKLVKKSKKTEDNLYKKLGEVEFNGIKITIPPETVPKKRFQKKIQRGRPEGEGWEKRNYSWFEYGRPKKRMGYQRYVDGLLGAPHTLELDYRVNNQPGIQELERIRLQVDLKDNEINIIHILSGYPYDGPPRDTRTYTVVNTIKFTDENIKQKFKEGLDEMYKEIKNVKHDVVKKSDFYQKVFQNPTWIRSFIDQ